MADVEGYSEDEDEDEEEDIDEDDEEEDDEEGGLNPSDDSSFTSDDYRQLSTVFALELTMCSHAQCRQPAEKAPAPQEEHS